jgi:hypothetical protein
MSGKTKSRVETSLSLLLQDKPLAGGEVIPVERFEEIFEFKRDTQEFGWLIHEVRKALHEKGLHLSGEGVSTTGCYSILHPSENHWVAKLSMARAERDLRDKETLLVNTDQNGFDAMQKMRHENTLRLVSLRLSALRATQTHNEKVSRKRKALIEQTEPTLDEE